MSEERKPPWEERWNLDGGVWEFWPPENPTDEWRAHNVARMKLAECAPEMYRMLVRVSTDGSIGCPVCASLGRHSDDCELNALLKRARGETT